MEKLSEILPTVQEEASDSLLNGKNNTQEILQTADTSLLKAEEVVKEVLQDAYTSLLNVQKAVLEVVNQDVSGALLWQSYIDCLQTNISIQQFLSSEEKKFVESICKDVSGIFLQPIYIYISQFSMKENLNFSEASKLILFIYKKIKETKLKNINIQNLLEYIVCSFIDSNLLVLENKEEIKKYTKELSELLEFKHIVPNVKIGCLGCIVC